MDWECVVLYNLWNDIPGRWSLKIKYGPWEVLEKWLQLGRFSYDLEKKMHEQKQKQQTNGNRAIWLVYWTDANVRSFWLVKRTLGWKNFMFEELSRNQSILRFDVILQHDWPIEQCLLHIRVFFGGKTKSPCFDLSILCLIKQIKNTYPNHF